MTASFLKFPGLFFIFWPIIIILSFEWSPLVLLFSSPLVLFSILWWLYWACQLHLVSPLLSCSIAFSARSKDLSPFAFFQFYPVVSWNSKVDHLAGSFFYWLSLGLVIWPRLSDLFVSQNPTGNVYSCVTHFQGQLLHCAYTICLYGQIQISCTLPSELLSHPVMSSLILFLC